MRLIALLPLLACGAPKPPPAAAPAPAEPAAAPTAPTAPAAPNAPCALDGPQGYAGCEGATVVITGSEAALVMQAPLMTAPARGDGPAPQQRYLDVPGTGQIVFVTTSEDRCAGSMTVMGTLKHVDLGGEPGTKESYQGWWVTDSTVACK